MQIEPEELEVEEDVRGDVNMDAKRNTPRSNIQWSDRPAAWSSWSSDNDGPPADYHRSVDRAVTAVIGNKTYPTPNDFHDVHPRDDIPLFARAQ